jgi:hypothetical protein
MTQTEDRTLGLEEKVGILEHSGKDKKKKKEVLTEHARPLGHH